MKVFAFQKLQKKTYNPSRFGKNDQVMYCM